MYKLYRSIPLEQRSYIIDKWGELPQIPKRELIFFDDETGVTFTTNDLHLKKVKRNKNVSRILDTYKSYIGKKQVSTLISVVNVKDISNISNFIKNLKKKFKKNGILIYAYYWQRDIGEVRFTPHYHIILIISRINKNLFSKVIENKRKKREKAELCNSLFRFTKYLQKKEIYAPNKKRSYGISKIFYLPSNFESI